MGRSVRPAGMSCLKESVWFFLLKHSYPLFNTITNWRIARTVLHPNFFEYSGSLNWMSVLCFHSLLFPIQLWLKSISACISSSWSNLIMSVRSVSHSLFWILPFFRDQKGSQLYKLHLELLMSFTAQRKELPPPLQKPDSKMPRQWSPPTGIHTLA